MRFKGTLAVIGVAFALSLAGQGAAEAGGWRRAPAGWGQVQTVRHRIYAPRYRNTYFVAGVGYDPYSYYYRAPRYYPYYNSGYWRPAWQMRRRPRVYYAQPPYYPAWGYPVGGCYKSCKRRRRAHHRRRYIKKGRHAAL